MDAYHPDWFAMFAFIVRPLKRLGLNAFAVSLSLSTALSPVLAAPVGGQVTAGVGVINQSGPATVINQASDRLIVEWQSFDTIKGETVTFLQPGSNAWALNRILSGQATQFDGSLFANGNVVITNGSGIHFGKNAFVDVGSLIATTSGISNQNFLSGNLIFDQPGSPDSMVTNAGSISVKDSGLAALVAPGVENSGVIQANLGTVILGAGEAHTIDFYGDGLVKFTITEPTKSTPKRTDGSDADGLVNNSGTVKADGGTVIMTAAQASNVLDNAINMSGIAQANSVSTRNGKIVLGGGSGRVKVTGKVLARSAPVQPLVAPIPATRGGTVHVTGDVIEISSTAEIDASGTNGGGEVLVGGALKGGTLSDDSQIGYVLDGDKVTLVVGENAGAEGLGYIQKASAATVADGAKIDARATESGDGGSVIVWGTDEVNFHGDVTTLGGDNGFVEVSTKGTGAIDGIAQTGHMLVDPGDVCIFLSDPTVCAVNATGVTFDTITGVLNNGGLFELNTDDTGTSGTGRVDFEGGFPLSITNNSDRIGTFEIHAADRIDTNQVVIQNNGTNGTNFEWYAGSAETTTPVASADIVLGPQVLDTGGGYAYFEAADDIRISDPVFTDGGDATFIARGGDGGSSIVIGAEGNPSDDHIDTTDGAGNAGAITFQTDSLTIDPNAATDPNLNAVIDAEGVGGVVTIRSTTDNRTINLGTASANSLSITAADIDRIAADVLRVGSLTAGNITISDEISPANVNTLSLLTSGAVLDGNIGTDISIDNLAFRTGAGFGTAGDGIGIDVDNLAFANTGGVVNLSNIGSMTIASVDGLVSSSNTGTTTDILILGNGTLTFAADTSSTDNATFSAPTISVSESVNVDVTAGALAFNGATVNLDGNLTASNDITGAATTVNVIGDDGGAEIQDAVDVAAVGATVNVGDGSFDGGINVNKALTLQGDGYTNTTTVNVADNAAGMTVTASDVTIDGFKFEGTGTPVNATGLVVDSTAGPVTNVFIGDTAADADMLGNQFTELTTGLLVSDGGSGNPTSVEIGMGNAFDNSTAGMVFSGSAVNIIGDTLNNTTFSSITDNYVELADSAEFAPGNPTIIDATGVSYDGVLGRVMTVAQLRLLEDKLTHYPDTTALGLLNTNDLFVVNGESIQTAVNAAGALGGPQTVSVEAGTFGGSVEVWVDALTLQGLGDTTIIDTDQVDAFANDGDVDNGFGVYEIATGGADPTGTGNVSGVTIDGFRFIGAARNNDGIVMGVNPVPVASTAIGTTISNVSFEGLQSAVYAEAISGNTLLDNLNGTDLEYGIEVTSALRGGSTFALQGSNLASSNDTLQFNGNIAGPGTRVNISSSILDSSDEEAIDINGVIANRAVVTIGGSGIGNSLTGGDDAIETDNIRRGVLNIANNTNIRGDDGAGIHVDGVIRLGSNVNIVGNDNISGGEDGLFFEGPVRDSTVNIAGNTLIEGEDRDGIIFYETVRRSNVTVGDATVDVGAGPVDFGANGSIVGGVHGIDVGRVVDSNTANGFKVSGNSFIAGGEDGIIFGNINNSIVEVVDNDAVTGLFGSGIQFAGNVVNGSNVTVDNNDIVAGLGAGIFIGDLFNIGGTRVSDSNINITRNGDENTPFTGIGGLLGGIMSTSRIIDGSTIAITDNEAIAGGLFGVNLVEDIADSEVRIANNGVIFGGLIAGIHVGSFLNPGATRMDGSTFTVENNDLITSFLGDGFASEMTIENGSTVNILENDEISGDVDGIYFGEEISDSFVNINGNMDIIGRNNQGILLNDLVISSDVAIGTAASGNGRIIGGDNGVAVAPVLGGSLRIVNNTEIRGESVDGISLIGGQDTTIEISDNDKILGDGFDGIYIDDTLVTSDFTVANNSQITGADDGMNIGFIIGGSVNINDNSQIRGIAGSGIEFDALVNKGAKLNVTGNSEIRGGEEGLEFDGDVENSTVVIADNASIVGETTDGILFNDVSGSEVVVSNNVAMGGVSGFSVENNSGTPSTSKFVFDRTTLTGGTGAGLSVITGPNAPVMEIDLSTLGGNVFAGSPSMFLSGKGLSLTGNTLGNTQFNSVGGGNFIELANDGLFEPGRPTIIDGSEAIFDGASVTLGGFSFALYIESRIVDFDDDATLGQIFFRDPTTNKSGLAVPTNIRITNIQAPGDHILRPVDILNILPEGVFGEDYKLGECSVTPDEDTGLLQVQCIVQPSGDISPFVVAFLATLSFGDVAALN